MWIEAERLGTRPVPHCGDRAQTPIGLGFCAPRLHLIQDLAVPYALRATVPTPDPTAGW